MKLSPFSYVIQYRPEKQNFGPDTLTRALCATQADSISSLQKLHDKHCHPGVTRTLHFIRTKICRFLLQKLNVLYLCIKFVQK